MLKLAPITQLAHSLEDLLSALREQQVQADPTVMSALYQGVDALSAQVESLLQQGEVAELSAVHSMLCQKLSALAEGQEPPNETTAAKVATAQYSNSSEMVADSVTSVLSTSDTVRVKLVKLEEMINLMGEMVSSHSSMRELAATARRLEQQCAQQLHGELPLALRHFAQEMRDSVLSQDKLMQELHDKALQLRMFVSRSAGFGRTLGERYRSILG